MRRLHLFPKRTRVSAPRAFLLLAGVTLGLAACSAQTSPQRPVLRLLSTGAKPRRVLRYGPETGSVQISRLHSRIRFGDAGSWDLRAVLRTSIRGVDEDGTIHASIAVKEVEVEAGGGIGDASFGDNARDVRALRGRSFEIRVDPRGTKAKLVGAHETENGANVILVALELFRVPFSKTAVGKGAVWQSYWNSYRLITPPGRRGTVLLEARVAESGGLAAEIGSGHGRAEFDTTRLWADSGAYTFVGASAVRTKEGGPLKREHESGTATIETE